MPVYHRALARQARLELPIAVVNIGGVANVTWIGADGDMLAFDTGPGNAMLDDWMASRTDQRIDEDGAFARRGCVDEQALQTLLGSTYFDKNPPKSLDRKDFSLSAVNHLSPEDGAATLTAFTNEALALSLVHMPGEPVMWIICGGGARNPELIKAIAKRLSAPVRTADDLGWSGSFMEAEAFAFLAIRSIRALQHTYPGTTGVAAPLTGGVLATA